MLTDRVDAYDPAHTWTISTPLAGITVTALMVVGTASAVPIVGVYNPASSGKIVLVRRAVYVQVTGTVANPIWGAINTTITTTGVSAIRHSTFANTGTPLSPSGFQTYGGATAVSGTSFVYRPMSGGMIAGATAAGGLPPRDHEFLDPPIEVPMGCFIGLFGDVTTSAGVVRAAITATAISKP